MTTSKIITIEGIGEVTLKKSSRNNKLRLSIKSADKVTVSLPTLSPFFLGEKFARDNKAWIADHQAKLRSKINLWSNGQNIGKQHRLVLSRTTALKTIKSRVGNNIVTVKIPMSMSETDTLAQVAVNNAVVKAYKLEAEIILPVLLNQLSTEHNLPYKDLKITRFRTKWGSCSGHNDIALNYMLMQLPDTHIRYVLLHELAHTVHHNHKPNFWQKVEQMVPDCKQIRNDLKNYNAS
jgi:predicted metal-dependent hydrolase